MLAEQPVDLGANLGFCGGAVRPINGEISADALDGLTRGLCKRWTVENGLYLLAEHPGLRLAGAGPTADLVVEELLEQPHLAANPSSGQADPGHPRPLPRDADAMFLEYK